MTSDQPVHRRVIEIDVGEDAGVLTVTGRLRDQRPWHPDPDRVLLHDVGLTLTVRLPDCVIETAVADMTAFPHAECPFIAPAFAGLVGMTVGRGFTKALQSTFGGVSGCSHLVELTRAMGPAVIQAKTGLPVREAALTGQPLAPRPRAWLTGGCHIWAPGGVAERKLATGWQGGFGPYPAPPVEQLEGR